MRLPVRVLCVMGALTCLAGHPAWAQAGRPAMAADPVASRVDAHVARVRLLVLTDIANEPDDQMSLVRLLVYGNQFDIEGLVATTSTWLKTGVRPDVLHTVLDAYAQVQPNLLLHAPGFPAAADLKRLVAAGQPGYGMAATGAGKTSPGAALLLAAMRRDDPRPLWVTAWGGTNTLAQALIDARAALTPEQLRTLVSRLRVYAISDQDDAGAWLRRKFPDLHFIGVPSTQDGQEYAAATWTGISGDRFYRNAPGADFRTFTDGWVDANIRARGPLGKHYPYPCCIHEGDTPSFLGLIDNGLDSAMSPTFGGWGGRYVWLQPHGEPRAFWTQGGDAYPGRASSRDTVRGSDGQMYTSDQATIWRWREAFQHDFAARMAWTVLPREGANHNPQVVVNGAAGTAPILVDARVGTPVALDARETRDPEGHALTFRWWYYPEAGTGIPGRPVLTAPGGAPPAATNASPPAARGEREPARVQVERGEEAQASVTPRLPGVAHVILEVTDDGTPRLTSYRRVILTIDR
ncbi:DUF1593 domain-containing protein [Luteitalea pratensis]|nr:DUF1593 domain-containing protein [Luteitalea pratensis]